MPDDETHRALYFRLANHRTPPQMLHVSGGHRRLSRTRDGGRALTPERARQITDHLQSALERSGAERTAFLEAACAGDPALRVELDALLASEARASQFLAGAALTEASALLAPIADEFVRPEPGARLGHYVIERRIGSGGMGEVFLAEDVRLGRKVALKLLDSALADDSVARARFLREARLASALEHPYICTVYEVGEFQDRLFIAMQFVEGQTLRDVIGGRPVELDRFLPIARQVAEALAAAHARGIVHRDVKSSNLMVTPEHGVKVLDFGLAILFERDGGANVTVPGTILGTPASMAPEQARGERVGPRGDVFSFGVMLYEMATGVMPFTGRSSADVVDALLNAPHTPVLTVNPSIPLALARVIDRALSKSPSDRYQSMTELLADLRALEPHGESDASVGRQGVRRQRVLAAALLLVASAAALLMFLATRRSGPAQTTDTQVRSIAVLPFRPLVADHRDEVLQLGMADTLITKLSAIRNISVRPITAVRKYDALEQDAIAAGREQRVDAVVDGRIQKEGERVRITVLLLSVQDGRQLWADQFDQPRTDIFSLQDTVSERVSTALVVTLSGDEKSLLTKRHTASVEAYELYLLGRYHLNRLTDEGFSKALDYFADAVAKDPAYAAAHAGIAEAHFNLSSFNAVRPQDGFPKARAAAEQALRLDDSLAAAHAVLAGATFLHDWNWTAPEAGYRRALQLNPSASDAHMQYGFYLACLGRSEEALRETRRALALDPLSPAKTSGIGDVPLPGPAIRPGRSTVSAGAGDRSEFRLRALGPGPRVDAATPVRRCVRDPEPGDRFIR